MTNIARKDERRIFEHFVIAGLQGGAEHISPTAQECGRRNTEPLAPITDICVIFPTLGETVPDGFEIIETTPLAYPADLNHGSLRVASCFLCFRRGYHKPPLIDIGVLDQGRGEKPMVDSATVLTTPFGKSANVNNSSHGIFLTYRRAPPNSAPSQLVVTHICVIIASKGEIPPHTYYKIPKNLNKGLVGSEVYICYKKSLGSAKRLAYKPAILDYFPKAENSEEPKTEDSDDLKLLSNVPLFCLPMGALIECWPNKCQTPERQYSTFVLTDEYNRKYYGASVTFYERYTGELSEEQLEKLGIEIPDNEKVVGAVDDTGSTNDPAEQLSFHTNISICIVSRYPFFYPFKRFLFYIHRMSLSPSTIHAVPIERYISHLMYEVSFPSLRRPRVLMQLGAEMVTFEAQDEQQLPQYGAALFEALKSLGADNMMYLILLALLEQKILIHSLRPWLLTAVAESVCTLMFPFHWQCPYVPQCPLSLAGVLHAPLPFIAGVDSRYFDLYEDPPQDVTCFDLDTQTISGSTARHETKIGMLPKKPMKKLRGALEALNKQIQTQDFNVGQIQTKSDFVRPDVEQQLQIKKKMIEIGIQEAFLKFMASLMKGYQAFLRPIVTAPKCKSATDTGNLFDVDGFLKTREKEKQEFYRRFCSTQSFIRFIEERSFVSDKSAYNAFFDDCVQKTILADALSTEVGQLLEIDTSLSSNTVFIPPPEPLLNLESGGEKGFRYNGFPRVLDLKNFQLNKLNIVQNHDSKQQIPVDQEIGRCAAVRTKHETRSSLMMAANGVRTQKLSWPKTLLFYAYSLWFMQLPSMLAISRNKRKTLRLAFHVLTRLESTEVIPLDQVCYRILIELCGQCGEPHLAVRVLHAMRRSGLEQNAVTYGLYHRAVMNAEWPSPSRVRSEQIWRRIRLQLLGMTYFRNKRKFSGSQKAAPDAISVSDPGYHSEAVATMSSNPQIKIEIGENEEGFGEDNPLERNDYTITYTPLDDESISLGNTVQDDPGSRRTTSPFRKYTPEPTSADPLGAFHAEHDLHERQRSAPPEVYMSPARAKFLADHRDETLFKDEVTDHKPEKEKKGGGWLKGITNSPLMKMIRSQTTDQLDKRSSVSDGSGGSENAATGTIGAFVASPSLHNIVSQVKRGYDEVVREGGSSGFGAGVSSKLRLGMSSFVQEVKGLQRSAGLIGSGQLFNSDDMDSTLSGHLEESNPLFQLESGSADTLLDERFWTSGLFDTDDIPSTSQILDVTLCVATPCPYCHNMIYDEDIMAGWKGTFQTNPMIVEVEDQNMNTECPFCHVHSAENKEHAGCFAPMLHIGFQWKENCRSSWYQPCLKTASKQDGSLPKVLDEVQLQPLPPSLTVAFISPIILRRELETVVAQDMLSLTSKGLIETHPVIFWNLVYFLRRLALPSHLFSWIGPNIHLRCVYDRPKHHPIVSPLYTSNPVYENQNFLASHASRENFRKQVTSAVNESNMFKAIQALVNESRTVNDGVVSLSVHFPIFRDIQFASIDEFGRALNRTNLDEAYQKEFERLPPRILPLLPVQDYPSPFINRACKMIFLPLDLF